MQLLLSEGEIDKFLRNRVCGRCYGDLVKSFAPNRKYTANCPECGDKWHGATISRITAELREQQAISEYYEIRFDPALADILPPRRTERQIYEDLELQ